MRGTVAKRIRQEARQAAADNPTQGFIKRITKKVRGYSVNRDIVRYEGYRRIYQDLKSAYKLKERNAL